MSYNDGIEHPSKNKNHSRRNGVNTMKDFSTPCITTCDYANDIVVAVRISYEDEPNYTPIRNLVGFSKDGARLSVDLLNQIAERNWISHYHEGHYYTDMENRLFIESFGGWKADAFELEDALISFDGLKWRISNDEGQEIVLDDWSKDRPFLRWVNNPIEH